MHRPMLVFRQPNLLCIDGIPVSPEERTKAELYFMEQQVGPAGVNVCHTCDWKKMQYFLEIWSTYVLPKCEFYGFFRQFFVQKRLKYPL